MFRNCFVSSQSISLSFLCFSLVTIKARQNMGDRVPLVFFFFSLFLPYLCRLTGSGLQNSANCSGIKVKLCKIYSTWLANPEDLPVRSSWHCTSGYKVFPNPRSQGPLGNRHTRKRKDPRDKVEHFETM